MVWKNFLSSHKLHTDFIGKYCLHLHKLHDCPTCLFRNNAIEGSHQRGIIIHGTHSSTVESNVLFNVRGAGIYVEDGNEMYNHIKYNAVVCPNPFGDTVLHGCTVPGTSNRLADTSDNHSGIFSKAFTNSLTGNRVANAFNGMFFAAGGMGRGESNGKVCESAAKLARIEGNTFHGNGRFGTYTLGANYAKVNIVFPHYHVQCTHHMAFSNLPGRQTEPPADQIQGNRPKHIKRWSQP